MGHCIVGDIAHSPSLKTGQVRHTNETEPTYLLFDKRQRVNRGCIPSCAQYPVRLRAQEAVARQPFASLHAVEEERVVATRYLQEGGNRRLQVGYHLAPDGHQVAIC